MTTNLPSDQYFAGLFDGEGCVSMSLAKAGYMSVVVKVTMCDRAPVEALHQRFGGHFQDGKSRTKTGRTVYSWSVYNADAVEALVLFSQNCLVKRTVALAALPVAESMAKNPVRGVLSKEEKHARVEAAKLIAAINKPVGKRLVLNRSAVENYMKPKRLGGGKRVRLSDGREFETLSDAANALGVSISAVSIAKRKGTKTAGVMVEAL